MIDATTTYPFTWEDHQVLYSYSEGIDKRYGNHTLGIDINKLIMVASRVASSK